MYVVLSSGLRTCAIYDEACLMPHAFLNGKYIFFYNKQNSVVVEWSRALDVRLSECCCSVSMVRVQIPSREEQNFDSSKI
jgi:hypothetical protein